MHKVRSPWLSSPRKEIAVILLPLFLPVIFVLVFQEYFNTHQQVTSGWWLVLVLMVDVSHVYSTLFRFYWEKDTFQKHRTLLLIIPVFAFSVGVFVHWWDSFLFWRLLAYIAVYHFVRQQFGFIRLYSRYEKRHAIDKWIDAVAVYNATLYPLLYWHIHLTDKLSWFVSNDLVSLSLGWFQPVLFPLFILIALIYIVKEMYYSWKEQTLNIPKNSIMMGTYLSWYVGIVLFNGDLTFTLLNVVAHGIPYMGLIWMYGEKKAKGRFQFGMKGVAIFCAVIFFLAYVEETFWDVLVWKDHTNLFPFFTYRQLISNEIVMSIVVALLVLPQITHYVVDGFIWKFSKDSSARIDGKT
ncbi:MAG: hypothetical protein DI538_00475 [Azospira oryzae]|nr:MAG: hypothetical protein DI538_00475 [Azospira oryzae]